MKGATTGKISQTEPRTDWKRLRGMTDQQIRAGIISDPDAVPMNEAFWAKAHVVMPRRKEIVTLRLDADLLAWLRRERGYQTRINAILRAYMNASRGKRRPNSQTATARAVSSPRHQKGASTK
jgi:uncharacterized protein (DUF4415 family)